LWVQAGAWGQTPRRRVDIMQNDEHGGGRWFDLVCTAKQWGINRIAGLLLMFFEKHVTLATKLPPSPPTAQMSNRPGALFPEPMTRPHYADGWVAQSPLVKCPTWISETGFFRLGYVRSPYSASVASPV
jgi:hypothetical protein